MNAEKSPRSKEAYDKPKLLTIELFADEVLAFGCKKGFGAPGRQNVCQNSPCRNISGYGS